MDGKIDPITLIALIVAVVAILKLRSVLGRRTSEDDARLEERARAEQARQRALAHEKVVTMPQRGDAEMARGGHIDKDTLADVEEKIRKFAKTREVEDGLMAILHADNSFDPDRFLSGAKQAYEMIVTAYAEGNRKLLGDLLSEDVLEGFSAAIAEREDRGEQIDQSFVGINKADIVEAEVKSGTAQITIKFVSQLISATLNKTGQVISGDTQSIKEVTDIWSFARELSSPNPNWKLVATQGAA